MCYEERKGQDKKAKRMYTYLKMLGKKENDKKK